MSPQQKQDNIAYLVAALALAAGILFGFLIRANQPPTYPDIQQLGPR